MPELLPDATNQAEEVGSDYNNAMEFFSIYDTIQIGKLASGPSSYASYADFAAHQQHHFFNVRNYGEVGLAFTNRETKDQMSFVFQIQSIGLSFHGMLGRSNVSGIPDDDAGALAEMLFLKELPRHCGARLKVREDFKLLNTVELMPEGVGPFGLSFSQFGTQNAMTTATGGRAQLRNRFRYAKDTMINVPRGATFLLELELSDYARELFAQIPGPVNYAFAAEAGNNVKFGKLSTIRASIAGRRFVQQRNELHFG